MNVIKKKWSVIGLQSSEWAGQFVECPKATDRNANIEMDDSNVQKKLHLLTS